MKTALNDYVRGSEVATRLVNTAPRVRQQGGEELVDSAALAAFLARHDVLSATAGNAPRDGDLREVLALRDEVRTVLEAAAAGDAVTGGGDLVARSGVRPMLHRDAQGDWQWYAEAVPSSSLADQLAGLIGVGLLGVVRALGHERIRGCEASDCDGMFVDTSRAGRRRYCTPELCGNRQNVSNFRARRRTDREM